MSELTCLSRHVGCANSAGRTFTEEVAVRDGQGRSGPPRAARRGSARAGRRRPRAGGAHRRGPQPRRLQHACRRHGHPAEPHEPRRHRRGALVLGRRHEGRVLEHPHRRPRRLRARPRHGRGDAAHEHRRARVRPRAVARRRADRVRRTDGFSNRTYVMDADGTDERIVVHRSASASPTTITRAGRRTRRASCSRPASPPRTTTATASRSSTPTTRPARGSTAARGARPPA